jgi:hypothetical protein
MPPDRGGGGRQTYAAWDGADTAGIQQDSRTMVCSVKGIFGDISKPEMYATICDCGMDLDIAVERLILQVARYLLDPSLRSPGSNCLAPISWPGDRQTTTGFEYRVVIAGCRPIVRLQLNPVTV